MKYLYLVSFVLLLIILIFVIPAFQVIDGREVILQEIDYYEILKAGRILINQAERRGCFEEDYGRITLPRDIEIPEVIFELEQKLDSLDGVITIDKTHRLRIVFSSHMDGYFGLHIYPEYFEKPKETMFYKYGDKELLPGLWYFDNKYSHPKYDKIVDDMINKNKGALTFEGLMEDGP